MTPQTIDRLYFIGVGLAWGFPIGFTAAWRIARSTVEAYRDAFSEFHLILLRGRAAGARLREPAAGDPPPSPVVH